MAKREFSVEIEADGKLKVETGDMSGPYHIDADEFLKELARLCGGVRETKSTKGKHHHHHHGEAGQHHTH